MSSNKISNKYLTAVFIFCLFFFLLFQFSQTVKNKTSDMFASVFFVKSVDTEEIRQRYDDANSRSNNRKNTDGVKIIIIPGHDDIYSGAMFGSIKEADLNVVVAKELYALLSKEKGITTFLTRDENGYHPDLAQYLAQNREEIFRFREEKKQIMDELIAMGKVYSYVNMHRNSARPEIVRVLYGINKFANENDFDMAIHIHFNDYPGRTGSFGKYSGFSIYIPERQYSNADASLDLAEKIRDQLYLISASSNLSIEDAINEDQELIAVGSYNTADSASVLVEYGYIYESHFTDPLVDDFVFKELARQTYLGVMNFLKKEPTTKETYPVFKNYKWTRNLSLGSRGHDVLALQAYLRDAGYYPYNDNLNNCPINGNFGNCTRNSVIKYQQDNGFSPNGIWPATK